MELKIYFVSHLINALARFLIHPKMCKKTNFFYFFLSEPSAVILLKTIFHYVATLSDI